MGILVIATVVMLTAPEVTLTLIDDEAIGYATFQSHNQKVVQNKRGIFLTYLRTRNEAYTAQTWRLMHSADNGETFQPIFEATDATNPPVIETDSNDTLYLVRTDFVEGDAYLYRFHPEDNYATHETTHIPRGAAGKYAMILDEPRKRIYYFAHNNTFHTLDLDGNLLSSVELTRGGENAVLQYPHLNLDGDGRLHAAWTTQQHGVYMYWDIHHVLRDTLDGSWRTLGGGNLTLPIVVDDSGPTLRMSLDDEFESHTWLSSLALKGDKIHVAYMAQTDPPREHYMRYDGKTGERDIHLHPRFGGEAFEVMSLGGYFATPDTTAESSLFFIGAHDGRVVALRSEDNGATWDDHARTQEQFNVYSIGGARHTTDDGYIIGTFTGQKSGTSASSRASAVYFFRIAIAP